MIITKERVYLIVIVVLLLLFGLREGCNRRNEDKLVNEITNYHSEAKHYNDKFGNVIATNTAIHLATQNQIKTLLASNDTMKAWINKFKSIQAGVVIHEKTLIREVAVPYETKIPCDFKPFPAFKIHKDYRFYSTIANTGLTIDSMIIPNTENIIVGEKKTGFLKLNNEFTIEVKNSNPLVSVSNLSAYTYKPKKKWYERPIVYLGVGLTTGFIGTQYLNNKFGK